ncbi:MAG: tRNA preQ1(34) S-adenosylmethionine ribosyltransferase-isomerase QueA [Thermodesulfobacteriota bacterium]|nr:MAG: tRNA preQ1(34) S-adenosylmethionine ribosyltransferase-isomerase QueA [Thermodesulfobacteriota bacterium]
MELKDFDYNLPDGLIAGYPLEERDSSRLMSLNRATGGLIHRTFSDIRELLRPGDVLVLNNTKVIAARLKGRKSTGGGAELLLVERLGERLGREETAGRELWKVLARPAKGLGLGKKVFFSKGVSAEILDVNDGGARVAEFSGLKYGSLETIGEVPLPPYLRRPPEEIDTLRYQTVYAEVPGAVAAPTAGLHFTRALLDELKASGVDIRYITLHTGPATFLPVREENFGDRSPGGETYAIRGVDFNAILEAKKDKRRVVAVGTTTTRALESAAAGGLESPLLEGTTSLFIRPGFEFKVIDALVTNFHLPRSTLIMLVSAFAGLENLKSAYREAVAEGYRFYSYGDVMFIA